MKLWSTYIACSQPYKDYIQSKCKHLTDRGWSFGHHALLLSVPLSHDSWLTSLTSNTNSIVTEPGTVNVRMSLLRSMSVGQLLTYVLFLCLFLLLISILFISGLVWLRVTKSNQCSFLTRSFYTQLHLQSLVSHSPVENTLIIHWYSNAPWSES